MGWGWYLVIAIAVLLALPLFVPLIVRVRAKPGELEWSVAVGHVTVLPDFGERASRWKSRWGRVGYVLSRPLVWLVRLIVLLLRVMTWPVRAPLAWRRKRRAARAAARRESAARADIQLPHEPPEAPDPIPPSDVEDDAVSRDDVDDEPKPSSEEAGFDVDPSAAEPERDTSGDSEEEPPRLSEGVGPEASESPAVEPEDEGETGEKPGQPPPAEPPPPPPTRPPGPVGGETPGDDSDEPDSWLRGDETPGEDTADSRAPGKLARVLDQLATVKGYYDTYGRLGKRVLRAALLFVGDLFRAPRWRIFDLRWSAGGDPAALGQVLGWHHALTATIDPRLARHLVFTPQWDSEELALTGSARVQLEIWGYRFVPPVAKFFARLPWGGLIRLAWEQILSRRQRRKAARRSDGAS